MNRNKIKSKNESGFTLIELLVVISIIGLLSSAVLTTVSKVRSRARDVKRIEDTRVIINALALEYSTRGKFPCHALYDISSVDGDITNANFMKFLITDDLVKKAPADPLNLYSTNKYYYAYGTFKSKTNGPCGQVAYLDYTTENPISSCIANGLLFNGNHCHVFYPNPPNCPPWQDATLDSCNLKDTVNDY
jgi:prepilin-type N-terminal cleavage/methylation domain-containing protein